jgi:uncharacterized membrane protein
MGPVPAEAAARELPIGVPPHIAETIQAIALLHAEHHRKSSFSERVADQATAFVGRPVFLLILIFAAMAWIGFNLLVRAGGGAPPDPPPFACLGLILSISGLLVAVLILVTQRRADRFADLREQMTLEATLLTEQKTRKIIELIEELRRDSPQIVDRLDQEAEEMSSKGRTRTVLEAADATSEAGDLARDAVNAD